MIGRRRRTWRNHLGNVSCQPLLIERPSALAELTALVRQAEGDRVEIRAVGSGHSWSDVALTGGVLVLPQGLSAPLQVDPGSRAAPPGRSYVRVQAGMRLHELNAHLRSRGLALSNMGGYDHQTVAGVMATATHGSGLAFGPIADFAVSLDLVAAGGVVHRIEPSDGITDPAAFAARHPDQVLHQDDHWFRAARVGVGTLGILYAVTLSVEPAYWLTERRSLMTWSQARRALLDGGDLDRHRHYELLVNPHRQGGADHRVLLTTRDLATAAERAAGPDHRNWVIEVLSTVPLTPTAIDVVANLFPRRTPALLDRTLASLVDPGFTAISYDVLNIGTANLLPAYSAEIGVPVDARGLHVAAVERIFEIAERHARIGEVFHTSPVALRFVAASDAYLAMMEGRTTMMIELIQLSRTEGGLELLAAYEDALYELEGRPHWGQINHLTPPRVRALYPQLSRWEEVRHALDPDGVFAGPGSRRVGLTT